MDATNRPLQAFADQIIDARLSRSRLDAVAFSTSIGDFATAYAVQELVSAQCEHNGLGRAVGYKIGMSTDGAQKQYGLTEPISGHVFNSRLHMSPAALAVGRSRRIGVECEVAIRLGADLLPVSRPHDTDRVKGAVHSVYVAIEILEDRFVALDKASIWTLAADDMLGYGGVLGDSIMAFEPSVNRRGTIAIDGEISATGYSADLQGGGPLAGLAWLANRLARTGQNLKAGEVIFCGGITAPTWIRATGKETIIVAEVEGIGEARLTLRRENE